MSGSDASSDPEDVEYIPEGDGGRSESEESVDGEEEEKRGVSTTSTMSTRSSQRTHSQASSTTPPRRTSRRHSRPVKNVGGHEKEGGEGGEEEGEKREAEEKKQMEKARVDDLWESFKQDSAARPRRQVKSSDEPAGAAGPGDSSKARYMSCFHKGGVQTRKTDPKAETAKTVKIRKTYDFAGDEVVVEQEVAADSAEAQQLVSEHLTAPISTRAPVLDPLPTSSTSSAAPETGVRPSDTGPGKKRSGISSVLQSLAKKPKLSTLEKSQLDWKIFKAEEGLEHELAQQRKDGYLERQEFLQRTDWRQYELEREERLKKFNRLH